MADTTPRVRRPTMREKVLEEACRLGIDIETRSEDELQQAVRETWLKESKEALEAWNAWIEKNGLPLAKYRTF